MNIHLYAYRYSVYSWIARLALAVADVDYQYHEVDPFAEDPDPAFLDISPWCRVPVLVHDDFRVLETLALTSYVNERFAGSRLVPERPAQRARMYQVISIVDRDGYWPMVRQVFSHGYFQAIEGGEPDPEQLRIGLHRSGMVLSAIETLLDPVRKCTLSSLTLADIHLGPMVHYLCRSEDGAALLRECPTLSRWFTDLSELPVFLRTRPDLL